MINTNKRLVSKIDNRTHIQLFGPHSPETYKRNPYRKKMKTFVKTDKSIPSYTCFVNIFSFLMFKTKNELILQWSMYQIDILFSLKHIHCETEVRLPEHIAMLGSL